MSSDEEMARVRITKDIVVAPNKTSTILYEARWEGTAPRAHIEKIVAAGAGEEVNNQGEPKQQSGK